MNFHGASPRAVAEPGMLGLVDLDLELLRHPAPRSSLWKPRAATWEGETSDLRRHFGNFEPEEDGDLSDGAPPALGLPVEHLGVVQKGRGHHGATGDESGAEARESAKSVRGVFSAAPPEALR